MKMNSQVLNTRGDLSENGTEHVLERETAITCSFSGRTAHFYVGLANENASDDFQAAGAVCETYVEKALNNLLGQGTGNASWPVVMDLNKKIIYHSYDAHQDGISAILGWKRYLGAKSTI